MRGQGENVAVDTLSRPRDSQPDAWRAQLHDGFASFSDEDMTDLRQAVEAVLAADPIVSPDPDPIYPALPDAERSELPPTAPQLIGVCGAPRAGKDVIADFISSNYKNIERLAFSDSVIPEVNDFLAHVAPEHKITAGNKSEPIYRHLLQAWGMTLPQADPDYWVKQTEAKITELRSGGTRTVILTGVRLDPDVDFVHAQGGSVWRANRPDNPYQAAHAVESQVDKLAVDRDILNLVEGDLKPYEQNILTALADGC